MLTKSRCSSKTGWWLNIDGLAEVNDSNYSKFEYGKPVFNKQGKISKGKYYKPPQLDKFI
jgi:hypothetical protein